QSEGRYWIEVLDSLGNSLFVDADVRIAGPEDAHRDVRIDLVTVRGSLALGKEPLAATLWFGGRHASPGGRVEDDGRGRVDGVLPRKGRWRVQIAAAKPALEALRAVVVEPDRAGRAEVDIRLADTHLLGRVLDEQERPVPRARVEISSGLPVSVHLVSDE